MGDKSWEAVQKVDTVLNADAVEWCPYSGANDVLLCGTYKLQEQEKSQSEEASSLTADHTQPCQETENKASSNATSTVESQVRVGGITVFRLGFPKNASPSLQEISKVQMCGVLDIKWPDVKLQDKAIFGVVDAEGYFQMFQLQEESYTAETVFKGKLSESSLGLSLGWSGQSESSKCILAASDSAGSVTVFDISDSINVISSWKAHDYEAWITAVHKFDHNVIYSGGDDCRLKVWDLRDTSRPTCTIKRHQMGVCSIQSHPFDKHLLASGSYDEELLIWDTRNYKQPLCDVNLGGGVWRIKWDPFSGTRILTATMYNGTHIVDCSKLGEKSLSIAAQYDDHNLAYGADWCRLSPSENVRNCDGNTEESSDSEPFLISTCSFYDHSLHLWQWNATIKS